MAIPPSPSIEEVFTMEPPPFLRMVRATDFIPRKQPSWLTRKTSSNSSTSMCSTVAEAQDAGVVDQHVDRPEPLVGLLDQRLPGRLVADVVAPEVRRVGSFGAELVGQRLPRLLGDVGDHDLSTLRDEGSRDLGALSLRRPGDDRALAGESVHQLPSVVGLSVGALPRSITESAAKPTAGSRSAK